MTQQEANEIVKKATRCTEATLMAFGIKGIPSYGSGCLEYFTSNGFKLVKLYGSKVIDLKHTAYKTGSYFIQTEGHAMALIDGILIDTARQGFDNRKIEFMWEVTK